MSNEAIFTIAFAIFIIAMLAIDLGLFTKTDKAVSLKQAGIMSAIWVLLALIFGGLIYQFGDMLHGIHDFARLQLINEQHFHNLKLIPDDFEQSLLIYKHNLALEYITGYVIEYALSVDNIFVMVLVFNAFNVEQKYYHRVLFWGILGAVIMRFIFIFLGATLIKEFSWILYVFGAFLIYTGFTMFINRNKKEEIDTHKHPVVVFASRFFAVHPRFEGKKFFIKIDNKKYITPLFLVLLIIEFTDVVFAVDSIPAIFSITKDPYIVFFSNIFAILGLRSMFFLLVNIIDKFHYLKVGLAFLLFFIGVKMLIHGWLEQIGFTTMHSLLIILATLVASLMFPQKAEVKA
jgi:tellurite resistance protein TerC